MDTVSVPLVWSTSAAKASHVVDIRGELLEECGHKLRSSIKTVSIFGVSFLIFEVILESFYFLS